MSLGLIGGLKDGAVAYGTTAGTAAQGNDPRFSNLGGGVTFGMTSGTAAQGNDPRLAANNRRDLRYWYNAPCDPTTSHVMSAAAAIAMYPQCGATGPIEQDTAAWLQAQHDILNTAPGYGVIGLPDGGGMMVSQQLPITDVTRVHFHGGINVHLNTAGCGTTAAISLDVPSGYTSADFQEVLKDFKMAPMAPGGSLTPSATKGAAATGFVPGSTAVIVADCPGLKFTRIEFSMYDIPEHWGDNEYIVIYDTCNWHDNNIGINLQKFTTRKNSGENIQWIRGATANNNINVQIDCSTIDGQNLGGSFDITGISNDYWYQLAISFIGGSDGTGFSPNRLTLMAGHMESTGALSGQGCPIYVRNAILVVIALEIQWSDSLAPLGIVTTDVAYYNSARTMVTLVGCGQLGMIVPWGYAANDTTLNIHAYGCHTQDGRLTPLYKNSNGTWPIPNAISDNCGDLVIGSNCTARAEWMGERVAITGTCTITLPSGSLIPKRRFIYFVLAGSEYQGGGDGPIVTFQGDGNNTLQIPPGSLPTMGGPHAVAGLEVAVMCIGDSWFANGALNVNPTAAGTSSVKNVNAVTAGAAGNLLAANANRNRYLLENDSTANAYVLEGSGTASPTNFSFQLTANQQYATTDWRGAVSAVWDSANGAMRVTEQTP